MKYEERIKMRKQFENDISVEDFLEEINPFGNLTSETLEEVFDRRLQELNISRTNVRKHINMSYSTLKGLLAGTQKLVDITNLIKMASFLQLPKERVILLYINSLEKNLIIDTTESKKIKFIKDNFDLVVLKKAGFIESVTDFLHVEKTIVEAFDLKSIFDYKKPLGDVAFSAGVIKPKNDLARSVWIKRAIDSFTLIDNPYDYDKNSLLGFFSEIRWHSTNVELGLISVIKTLFKYGVTVLYQPPFSSLHLRGATINVNNKPCIVLTDYKGFYPTLWFALLHELHHVIFDWDDIKYNRYHITDDDEELMSIREREDAANNFAREYLLPGEKLKKIKPHLNNR
ncbi:ImmA/IrrE family metallo-endopeptidase [bacterium]|nr:MAG: ImmA/IrrE family metallo-endopeptidase [bacterium]